MSDETWAYHHTPESKSQLIQWHHTKFPSAKKFKNELYFKIVVSMFWERKNVLLIDSLVSGETINTEK